MQFLSRQIAFLNKNASFQMLFYDFKSQRKLFYECDCAAQLMCRRTVFIGHFRFLWRPHKRGIKNRAIESFDVPNQRKYLLLRTTNKSTQKATNINVCRQANILCSYQLLHNYLYAYVVHFVCLPFSFPYS